MSKSMIIDIEEKDSSRVPDKEAETEQYLLQNLLKKQAELKKLQKEHRLLEKEIKKIESSRLWKYTYLFWKTVDILQKVNPWYRSSTRLMEEIHQLTEENRILHQRLIQENHNGPNLQQQDKGQLLASIKSAKEDGNLIEYLEALIQQRRLQDEQYTSALRYAAKLYKNERPELKQYVYNKVLPAFKIEEVPEFIVREEASLKSLASFRASLTRQYGKKQLTEGLPEWTLDNKMDAYRFIDQLNIKRPWVSNGKYSYADLPPEQGIVIKPVDGAGSRGVYLVYENDYIQDVRRGEILHDRQELLQRMKQDLDSSWVRQDEWMVEELIFENKVEKSSPRDLKFYSFYGEVALVLEIVRYPEVKYCWWTADMERMDTGKYENDLFTGAGFTASDLELAAKISLEIPAPFMRIDFLKTESEMVFGEFTPKPGNYDEFNQTVDQWLGDCYLRAESRLMNELINGKQFNHYNRLFSSSELAVGMKQK